MIKLELILFVFSGSGPLGQLIPLVQKSPLHRTPGKLGSSMHDGPLQWKFKEKPLPTPQSANWPLTMEPLILMMVRRRACGLSGCALCGTLSF